MTKDDGEALADAMNQAADFADALNDLTELLNTARLPGYAGVYLHFRENRGWRAAVGVAQAPRELDYDWGGWHQTPAAALREVAADTRKQYAKEDAAHRRKSKRRAVRTRRR